MAFVCTICNKLFSSLSNKNKHIRQFHKAESTQDNIIVQNYKCEEKDCELSFKYVKHFIGHLKENHNIFIETESLEFLNLQEFESWKSNLEKENNVSYFLPRSKKVIKDGRKWEYLCNRSGKYVTKSNGRRSLKSQGTCKLGGNCTSRINIQEVAEKVTVEWIKTHYGHSEEIQHIRLNKCDKESIGLKLLNGMSKEKILSSVRNNIGRDLKRVDLVNRQDIVNIGQMMYISRGGEYSVNQILKINETVESSGYISPEHFEVKIEPESDNSGDNALCSESTSDIGKKEKTKWSSEEVLWLLEAYRMHAPKFKDVSYTNKQIWNIIAQECKRPHCGHLCDSKFRNLKRTYKDIMQRKTSGNGSSSWEFFSVMDELLCYRPDVTPLATYESSEAGEIRRKESPPPKKTKTHSSSTDDSQGEDLDNPASVKVKKTLKRTASWMSEYRSIAEKKLKAKQDYLKLKIEQHKEKMAALNQIIELLKQKQ